MFFSVVSTLSSLLRIGEPQPCPILSVLVTASDVDPDLRPAVSFRSMTQNPSIRRLAVFRSTDHLLSLVNTTIMSSFLISLVTAFRAFQTTEDFTKPWL